MKRKGAILLFWILIWYFLALLVDNPILLTTPGRVLGRLGELLREKDFWQAAGLSLLRIGGGFFLGAFCGLLWAAAACKYKILEEFLAPLMSFLKAAPVAALTVLLLIWWGSELLSAVICFLVVFPGIYLHTLEGIKSTDRELLEMAKVFEMPFWNRFFYIYRPAVKPFLYGSLKIALGMSWKSGVAAEIIGTPAFSIGEGLYLSKVYLDTAGVFAWTVAVIVLSFCFERLTLYFTGLFFAWEPGCIRKKEIIRDKEASPGAFDFSKETPFLCCEGVCKAYGQQVVLKNFSAEYPPGEAHYLRGASGSGKTTLLRILCGLEQADAGRLERRGRCSVVFQEDRLCLGYSALRNVEMAGVAPERAKEALLLLLPGDALEKPCRELSGGMKRRVALVRAMEASSDILLLDEPFTGLDEEAVNMADNYIKSRQKGRILVLASHLAAPYKP